MTQCQAEKTKFCKMAQAWDLGPMFNRFGLGFGFGFTALFFLKKINNVPTECIIESYLTELGCNSANGVDLGWTSRPMI